MNFFFGLNFWICSVKNVKFGGSENFGVVLYFKQYKHLVIEEY